MMKLALQTSHKIRIGIYPQSPDDIFWHCVYISSSESPLAILMTKLISLTWLKGYFPFFFFFFTAQSLLKNGSQGLISYPNSNHTVHNFLVSKQIQWAGMNKIWPQTLVITIWFQALIRDCGYNAICQRTEVLISTLAVDTIYLKKKETRSHLGKINCLWYELWTADQNHHLAPKPLSKSKT